MRFSFLWYVKLLLIVGAIIVSVFIVSGSKRFILIAIAGVILLDVLKYSNIKEEEGIIRIEEKFLLFTLKSDELNPANVKLLNIQSNLNDYIEMIFAWGGSNKKIEIYNEISNYPDKVICPSHIDVNYFILAMKKYNKNISVNYF